MIVPVAISNAHVTGYAVNETVPSVAVSLSMSVVGVLRHPNTVAVQANVNGVGVWISVISP